MGAEIECLEENDVDSCSFLGLWCDLVLGRSATFLRGSSQLDRCIHGNCMLFLHPIHSLHEAILEGASFVGKGTAGLADPPGSACHCCRNCGGDPRHCGVLRGLSSFLETMCVQYLWLPSTF